MSQRFDLPRRTVTANHPRTTHDRSRTNSRRLRRPPVDSLPLMPITMMFAADQIGAAVWQIRRRLSRAGRGADSHGREVRFRLRLVHFRSRPRGGRLRGGDPVLRRSAAGGRRDPRRCWPTRRVLARLKMPDPLGGGRMHDRVQAAALFRERVGGAEADRRLDRRPLRRGRRSARHQPPDDRLLRRSGLRPRPVRVRAWRWGWSSPGRRSRRAPT